MALPSAVTIGSAAFVAIAGIGYAAVSAASANAPAAGPPHVHHSVPKVTVPPSKPVTTPQHGATKPRHHRSKPAVPSVLVEVFNNSSITGLAQQKAAILQGAGWHVAAVDNWYGNIPANTVYYPAALHADAVKLAKLLHITRLHPAVAPMQLDRLTVIFTGE